MADINFLETFTEDTQDKLEKTMLECSMLFALNRNQAFSEGRKDMFLRSVFAIISSETKEWTEQDVQQVFYEKFRKEINLELIRKAMQRLLKLGWLEKTARGLVPQEKIAEEIRGGLRKVDERTITLINEIIINVEKQLDAPLADEERALMINNINDTFNLYIRMYGFESFINNNPAENVEIVDDEDIVKAALKGLDQRKGEALLNALSYLIENPTREQTATMMLWVKMFLGSQIMRLDPQLSELEGYNLKGKTFVLDTDFLLYCLTDHPKQSKSYQKLLKILRKIGCELIIPEEVAMEVVKHAQCADSNYRRFKRLLKSVDKDIIEAKANNVFVKDYCLQDIESKHHQTLSQYMQNNFLSDEDPLGFMKQLIYDKLRIECKSDTRLSIDDDYLYLLDDLTTKIFLKTRYSDKDKWRSDEETKTLSETDAKLYLSILSMNKSVKETSTGGMLRAKAYLVTFTIKSIISAQEMKIHRNFVTRPELLINLMSEIGEFDDTKHGFINLFENPFLAHILEENWDMVKNLSEMGLNMHQKNITKLKDDLGVIYHKYITKNADKEVIETIPNFENVKLKSAKDFFAMAEEINNMEYEFIPEIQSMVDEYKEQTKRRMTAEEKQKIAESLLAKKVHGYKEYIKKTDTGAKRKNLGYMKKK